MKRFALAGILLVMLPTPSFCAVDLSAAVERERMQAALADSQVVGGIPSLTPAPRDAAWRARHEQLKALAATSGAEVVFFGGSAAAAWGTRPGDRIWRITFGKAPYHAVNLGIEGDCTQNLLWRLKNGALDGVKPRCVVLCAGGDNVALPNPEPVMDTALGVYEVVNEVRRLQSGAAVIVMALPVRGRSAADALRLRDERLNQAISSFAALRLGRVSWLDATDWLTMRDGSLPTGVCAKPWELTAEGFAILSDALLPRINAALADGARTGLLQPSLRSALRPGFVETAEPLATASVLSPWWSRDREKRRQILASGGEFDVVLLGDSITHGMESRDTKFYPDFCRRYRVLNLGTSGNRIENLRWRLENGELDGYRAKVFTIMIGINNTNAPRCTSAEIVAGVKGIVELVRRRHPESKVIVQGILPCGTSMKSGAPLVTVPANEELAGLADGKNVFWVDYGLKYVDAGGRVRKEYLYDFCHPNAEGYRFMHEALEPLLARLVSEGWLD